MTSQEMINDSVAQSIRQFFFINACLLAATGIFSSFMANILVLIVQ
jgi:hypothetical protein